MLPLTECLLSEINRQPLQHAYKGCLAPVGLPPVLSLCTPCSVLLAHIRNAGGTHGNICSTFIILSSERFIFIPFAMVAVRPQTLIAQSEETHL